MRECYSEGIDALLDLASYTPDGFNANAAAALKPGGRGASPLSAAGDEPGHTNVMAVPSPENLQRLGQKPGRPWAVMAGLSEFGGGVLTALGLLHPLGPVGTIAAMSMATTKTHWGKPMWQTEGGAELPVLNMTISTALMLRRPDKYSLDRLLGVRLPGWLAPLGLAAILLTVLYAGTGTPEPPQQQEEGPQDEARGELAGKAEQCGKKSARMWCARGATSVRGDSRKHSPGSTTQTRSRSCGEASSCIRSIPRV